ncbi:MAG: Holliday junction resolvase RuvX [Lachnospiraceae bacterium]|nr:Holliday junction resolvase RuvX [Lachnospiraceae bacterium]
MRMMGLDYGSTTVGVAMSDVLGITSQPGETIVREKENHLRRTLAQIVKLIEDNDIRLIVLGRPVRMDGSDGTRVKKTEEFCEALKKRIDIPIVWQDERLTTVEADEILADMEIPRSERKKYIDSVAASIILRDYMNQKEK